MRSKYFSAVKQCRLGKSAKWIRNFGKRIGSKGWVCRAASGSVRSRSGLVERGRTSPPVCAGVGGVCQ